MAELHELSALETAGAIRERRVSVPEVIDAALARPDVVGALTTVAADHARSLAAQAQQDLDREPRRPRSRLYGVPTVIKDLEATRGIRTTLGSAVWAGWVPGHDDEIVRVVRAGGLIDIGKSTVPELGAACYTEPEVAPPARSPFDRTLSAGGSSGGAAAAVGARLVAVAPGSDTAGSLRSPASACGVIGLKPSRGLITAGPDGSDGIGLSSRGPIARTVRDTAALLDVLAAAPGAGTIHPQETDGGFLGAIGVPLGRIRVIVAQGSVSGAEVDPGVAAATDAAALVLAGLGHDVDRRDQHPDPALVDAFTSTFAALAGAKPVPPADEHRLRPIVRHLRERARRETAAGLAAALHVLQARARAWVLAYADADIVLTPTVTAPPRPVGGLRDDADPAAELAAMTAYTGNTVIANATGQPSISLPLGWTGTGVPLGVMISARWGADALLLRVAAQLEEAMPWSHRYVR